MNKIKDVLIAVVIGVFSILSVVLCTIYSRRKIWNKEEA